MLAPSLAGDAGAVQINDNIGPFESASTSTVAGIGIPADRAFPRRRISALANEMQNRVAVRAKSSRKRATDQPGSSGDDDSHLMALDSGGLGGRVHALHSMAGTDE